MLFSSQGLEPSSQLQDDSQVLALGPAPRRICNVRLVPHLETILSNTLLQLHQPSVWTIQHKPCVQRAVHLAIERSVREVREAGKQSPHINIFSR